MLFSFPILFIYLFIFIATLGLTTLLARGTGIQDCFTSLMTVIAAVPLDLSDVSDLLGRNRRITSLVTA